MKEIKVGPISYLIGDGYTGGTCLQGEIYMPYKEMVNLLGEPTIANSTAGDKTDVEWVILATIGEESYIITIYNWKDGRSYNGEEGLYNKELCNWHIGGTTKIVQLLMDILVDRDKYLEVMKKENTPLLMSKEYGEAGQLLSTKILEADNE